MMKIGFFEIVIIFILAASFLSVIALAAFKLVKSKLPDWEKVYWTVAFVVLNLIAAIPFIIFYDYFLKPEKRQD
jgi:hypothetical protein